MTTTSTLPEPAAAASNGFVFKGDVCTNPEKVTVAVGELGAACALLVARNADGRWWPGYQLGGRNLAYVTIAPGAAGAEGSRVGHATRDSAIKAAANMALAHVHGLHAVPAAVKIGEAMRKIYGATDREEDAADWQPAPNKAAFKFDADGHCTNPERIEIPCPAGYQCALLVAQMADEQWTFGCIRAGEGEEIFKYPAQLIANGETDRESALETALVVALENGEPDRKINHALEQWRAARSETLAAAIAARVEDAPAAKTKRLDYAVVCPAAIKLVEAGENAAGIAVKLGLSGRQMDGVLKRIGREGPGPWMGTAPATFPDYSTTDRAVLEKRLEELMAAHAARPQTGPDSAREEIKIEGDEIEAELARRDGIVPAAKSEFVFDHNNTCTNPAGVVIAMPKKYDCRLLVASRGRNWFSGYELSGPSIRQHSSLVMGNGDGTATRGAALSIARDQVLRFLKAADEKKHAEAIEAVYEDARAGLRACFESTAAPESVPAPVTPEVPPAVLPGMAHTVNEVTGAFQSPEVVAVPVPKGSLCEIWLAQAEHGRWAFGYDYRLPGQGTAVPARLAEATHETRREALVAGLAYVRVQFGSIPQRGGTTAEENRLAHRCAEAVMRFEAELAACSPANTAPAAEAPVPRHYTTEFAEVAVAKVQPNPANHRRHYNATADAELAESMRLEGLHQPIAVRRFLAGESPEGEFALGDASAPEFEAIFGHRRLRAARIACEKEVREGRPPVLLTLPARIYSGLTRKQATAIALVENLQREDINSMEEAEGFAQLMADEALTQEGCADRVGKKRSTVANALGLLKLPEEIRELIREEKLTAAHGIALKRFVPEKVQDRAQFPTWAQVIKIMAEETIRAGAPAGSIEKGIPYVHTLITAGLATRIPVFGEHRITDKLRRHPAYFEASDGDWITFDVKGWAEEVKRREAAQREREEAERVAREAEVAKLTKNGRKQLNLADLRAEEYREMSDVNESLLELVPADKKAAAKGAAGRTTVVTDVELADRLKKALQKEIRLNREEVRDQIEEKALKKIRGLKRVSSREFAWLVYLLTDASGRQIRPNLTGQAAKNGCASLPGGKGLLDFDPFDYDDPAERQKRQRGRLALIAKFEPVELVKTMMADRLEAMLADMVESGPDSIGGRVLKWWLDTDTLWLLEEEDDGRAELVDRVKASAWYQKAMAGDAEGAE